MLKTPSIIGAVIIGVCMSANVAAASATEDNVPLSAWEVHEGDRFIADTAENIGYLVHADGTFMQFRIATGQRRVVRYIGRIYDATTPEKNWTARSKEIKGDRTTFGPQGIFLRLYDGDERTPYGIHSHRSIVAMLQDDIRYKSMGCILVSEEILSVIEQTMAKNGGALAVQTAYGVELPAGDHTIAWWGDQRY